MWSLWPVTIILLQLCVDLSHSHGRLRHPPGRSTMWRYDFDTPTNVNDHETNCGGFGRQWNKNKGFCGVCGDAYDMPQPRPNEMGGEYGLGVIGATLASGQQLEVEVELTAYHQGYFQMRLCPHNRRDRPVAQTCLDMHLLSRVNGNHMYYPAKPEPGGRYKISYQLPSDLTCDLCVLQWRYVAGNSWGKCDNGTEGIGCGAQEEFRACADIRITSTSGWYDSTPNNDVDTDGQINDIISGDSKGSTIEASTILLFLVIGVFSYYL